MIYNKSEKLIMKFLKDNNGGMLIEEFKQVIAMAKSRQEARMRILNLSEAICDHLVLYILFKKNKINIPTTWVREIKGFLTSIKKAHAKDWFSDQDILDIIGEEFNDSDSLIHKLEDYSESIKSKVVNQIEDIFKSKKNLSDLGVSLKDYIIYLDGSPLWVNL